MRKLQLKFIAPLILAGVVGGCGGGSPGGPTNPAPPVVPPAPTPNPDANLLGRIVYTSVQSGGVLHTYTAGTRAIASVAVNGVNPKFSPDGTVIAFQWGGPGVRVVNSDGTSSRILTTFGGTPSFDPTGQVLAFGDRATGVWKINLDGSGLVQLTSDGGFQPAWSPDGTRIAYSVTVGGTQQLFMMNADGSHQGQALTSKPTSLTRLTTNTGNDFEPSWSPDEKNISWSNVLDGLWIMNADGGNQHLVVQGGRQGSWGK